MSTCILLKIALTGNRFDFILLSVQNPMPRLITANTSSIGWFFPDIHKSRVLTPGQVKALTFVVQEHTFYWLDRTHHIIKMDGQGVNEVSSSIKISVRGRPFSMMLNLHVCHLCGVVWLAVVNSLGPSDAIWGWRSWSALVQVMACCLMAPSHYLNQYWLIISKVLWHSSEDIIIRRFEDTNQ